MEIQVLKSLGIEEEKKGFFKKLLSNKCLLGGAIVGTAVDVYSKIGGSVTINKGFHSIKSLLDFTSNVTLQGLPIGSFVMKSLGYLTGGMLVAIVIRTGIEVANNKDKAVQILIKEGVMFVIFAIGMGAIGLTCADAMETINNMVLPYIHVPNIPIKF